MLRTQVATYVMVGNLADLPSPASVPAGYLYHATDTGDCLILIIDAASGVRSWQEFCGATTMTGVEGPALLKFAGGSAALTVGGYFIADDVSTNSINSGGVTPDYPLARARTALNFMINLRAKGTLGDPVTVDFMVNGVAALSHTFLAGTVAPSQFNVPGPATVPANAIINVRVSSTSGTGTSQVSATVELF